MQPASPTASLQWHSRRNDACSSRQYSYVEVEAARGLAFVSRGASWRGGRPPIVDLRPEVELEMVSATQLINHNNSISAGFEKDVVVKAPLRLHDAGHGALRVFVGFIGFSGRTGSPSRAR